MEGINSPYRNSKLFSHDFLEEHLPDLPEWQIHKDELKAAREKLQSLFEQALPTTSEAALEEELIRPILGEVLGFSYIVQPSTAVFKTHRQPDYALFLSEEEKQGAKAFDGEKKLFEDALAVADAKSWDVNLDAIGPASQMHDYILISGVRWGVITSGRRWRLTHRDTVHELDTFFEIDVEGLLKAGDPASLKYFLVFFRAESFQPGGFLDHVLTQSVEYAQRVGAELKENVYEALRCLCQGFLDGNAELSPEDLPKIHQNALIILYRILFLLYAESERERELLPLSNTDYQERIGLCALKRKVSEQSDWLEEKHALWTDLCDLFRLINQGSESLGIYAYNGGLFDPQLHPQLERWQIGDRYLAEAVKLLACTEVEGRRGFLDYSALDVRELGSIYEGLLEHKLIQKNGALEWEKDRSQRKKTGSYYTPEYIVQYIVEQTVGPLVDEIQSGLKTDLDELTEKIRRARGENRKLLSKKKEKLLRDARERVLDLKILDPAMGSGHFLVSACDYLARRIAELEAELTGEETEEAVQELKRAVAVRCLYGVDLNPLATELAKLSLWLHTVAKGKPLSFLDHHLRTGNSLIGATVKELKSLPSEKVGEIGLWESKLVEDIGKAIRHLTFIKESTSDSRSDVEAKKEQWGLVNAWIGKYKQAANVWLSTYFRNKVKKEQYQQVLETAPSARFSQVTGKPFFQKAQEIAGEKRFFHWELEFPDVFFDRFGRPLGNPGFDVVIGNPPYGMTVNSEEKRFVRATFASSEGRDDKYKLFTEKAYALSKVGGFLSYITPNTILSNLFDMKLRRMLLERTEWQSLATFRFNVFEDPTVHTAVFVLRITEPNAKSAVRILSAITAPEKLKKRFAHLEYQDSFLDDPFCLISVAQCVSDADLTTRLAKSGQPLGEIAYIRQCIKTGNDRKYVKAFTGSSGKPWEPVLGGSDISRYCVIRSRKYLKYGAWLARNWQSPKFFERPKKIALRETSERITAALDADRRYLLSTVYSVYFREGYENGEELEYLLAILNSQLAQFFMNNLVFGLSQGAFTKARANHYARLPIRRIGFVTPKDERARLLEEVKRLYQGFLKTKVPAPILDLVERCLPKDDEGNFIQEEEKSDVVHDLLTYLAEQMIELSKQKQKEIQDFLKWIEREWETNIEDLALKTKLKGYHEHDFDEMLRIAKRNKKLIKPDPESREFQERLEQEWEASMKKLRPLKEKIQLTDNLIDQIVYKLYGLTEEEIEIVEGRV